ncbi:MAG: alpha/beta hydrolase-fold protein [Bacilli bacterium]|jgi:alpha-glucosidase|nr:alpha/beta hydrolase-fold protein [Bacilli bacterium]MDD3389247.1 alpha/beta hydrolase-fold protein [Bacilli bacterium]MDD4345118.1 alpha/beta hydrolase-fold protein [Bacilli bacterium]MDD4521053.1 alpha/beta hydrolase-fold protein [Bacilli bacterium]MDY0399962.1 alpha/beta hydrolase-fold protein [Bacilli bacterium]
MKIPKVFPGVSTGQLIITSLVMNTYPDQRERPIRIWLPPGYSQENPQNRYPVFYMHDGQNLFDSATSYAGEWEIDETITALIAKGDHGTIVVGIDNSQDRLNELSPNWPRILGIRKKINQPSGELYASFIVNTVKPYIDTHFHTLSNRSNTGIGGSSMGGVMSFYMLLTYPEIFGSGLLFSTAAQLYKYASIKNFVQTKISTMNDYPRIFLFAGGLERSITPYVKRLSHLLIKNNFPKENIATLIDPRAKHNELAWAKHFPNAYQWLTKK